MWNSISRTFVACALTLGLTISILAAEKKPAAGKAKASAPAKKPEKKTKKSDRKKSGKRKTGRKALPLEPAKDFNVAITKSSLGREYLMSASLIPQAGAPTSKGLAGKIVRFELFHDGLDLYESTQGLVVTHDLPAKRLITTFPIVSQDDNKVVIDFNKGMRRVFMEIWYASSSRFSSGDRDTVAELPMSRVFSVKKDKDRLAIRQSAQVRDRRINPNEEGRYEIRYFFQPYQRTGYKPKENAVDVERYAMFFATQPQLEPTTGRSTSKIARFDISKPIQFYYSSNTPKEYEQAVMDGILYWNRAFGKPLVKAAKAPKKISAPDSAHNVIQWVPWDSAGFAYADILVDPRTGQSQHGQAFMTSVFAISGKARARRMLRAMREYLEKTKDDDKAEKRGNGEIRFPGSTVCRLNQRDFATRFAKDLEAILDDEDLTDEAALRASQDYVREVVAHEVGHVVGLRHNFAGSLAATMTTKDLDDWWKAYVKGEDLSKWKDKFTSSSVMEYSNYKAGSFIGWQMRATESVMPHDKGTIQWGYFGSKDVVKEKMLFGTDDHVGRYGDLTVFDYGVEPVISAYDEIAAGIRGIPNRVIEEFISARAPFDPRDREPLETVSLSPRSYASSAVGDYRDMLKWFSSSTRSRRLERDYDFIGDLNKRDRAQAHWKSLNEQIEKLGGLDRAFFSFLPATLKLALKNPAAGITAADKISAATLSKRLETLLNSPSYSEFVGLDEKKYKFTDAEKKLILERGKKLFAEIEEAVLSYVIGYLATAKRDLGYAANEKLDDANNVSKLEQRIIDLASYVITAKDSKKTISGKVSKASVTVTDFKYDYNLRMAAAKALTDKVGSFASWSKEARSGLNKRLKADIDSQLNITNMKVFSDSMLSRSLRSWYLKESLLLRLLPVVRPPAPPSVKK